MTINGGMAMRAWYDIFSFDRGGPVDEQGIRDSGEIAAELIRREQERGISADRIVLAGFSQGGAMALHVGHRYDKRLAGIMVLSAYEVLEGTRASEGQAANAETPMLFCHGSVDDVVAMRRGKQAHAAYATDGRDVRWHDFPMAHQVTMEEIGVIKRWLRERIEG